MLLCSSQNLSGLLNLTPSSTDELLQRIDQPLTSAPGTTRKYLLSDYNRDGDSYRNPWTNNYEVSAERGANMTTSVIVARDWSFCTSSVSLSNCRKTPHHHPNPFSVIRSSQPPIDDGFKPSSKLRELETSFNEIFDSYRELYYEGGISSVYLWDLEDDSSGWAGCFLIMKDVKGDKHVKEGTWNSIHVVECNPIGEAFARAERSEDWSSKASKDSTPIASLTPLPRRLAPFRFRLHLQVDHDNNGNNGHRWYLPRGHEPRGFHDPPVLP